MNSNSFQNSSVNTFLNKVSEIIMHSVKYCISCQCYLHYHRQRILHSETATLLRQGEPRDSVQVLTTLLYKTGRRELAVVGTLNQFWTFYSHSHTFPNIKFGFNGRKFIVTTNMGDNLIFSLLLVR